MADWDELDDEGVDGDSKGEPKKALVLELGEGSERGKDDSEAGEYE